MIKIITLLLVYSLIVTQKTPNYSNITVDEMDILLACSYLLTDQLQFDQKKINETAVRILKPNETFSAKASHEMFTKCKDSIPLDEAHAIFYHLVFMGDRDITNFRKYVELDYSKYNKSSNINLTPEEAELAQKFDYIRGKYFEKAADDKRASKNKISVGGLDIANIHPMTKSIIFLVVISIMAFGFVFLLGKVIKKPKTSKKKKKN